MHVLAGHAICLTFTSISKLLSSQVQDMWEYTIYPRITRTTKYTYV